MKATREQRNHDKKNKLSENYEGDGTNVEDVLSIATVSNEEHNDNDEQNNSYVSETDSYCRHCLRPQSELQLRYMRPRQRSKLRQQQHTKRERSKQRFSSYCAGSASGNLNKSIGGIQTQKTRTKKSRSKSRAKRARNNNKNTTSSNNNNNNELQLKLPLIRDLNAANEQAIRFRCPQVGPQVGRDRQMPPMLHFHHPQHVQKQLTAYQVQYTHVYGQHEQQQYFGGQRVTSPMTKTTLTIESELKQQRQHRHHHLHHHHHHYCHQHNEHLSNNQESNKNQQEQLVTTANDLTATKPTIIAHNLQDCCSSIHQQNQQTSHRQCPQCDIDGKRQANCCNTLHTTTTTRCACYLTNAAMTTTQYCHSQHPHNHHCPHPQQHYNLPQLKFTHLETAASTAVASLDTTTLVVTATTTTTYTNTSIPFSQTSITPSLPPSDEPGNSNLNNLATAEEDPSNLAVATTPDSPSLVKVSTWYTVAKQGVSC